MVEGWDLIVQSIRDYIIITMLTIMLQSFIVVHVIDCNKPREEYTFGGDNRGFFMNRMFDFSTGRPKTINYLRCTKLAT